MNTHEPTHAQKSTQKASVLRRLWPATIFVAALCGLVFFFYEANSTPKPVHPIASPTTDSRYNTAKAVFSKYSKAAPGHVTRTQWIRLADEFHDIYKKDSTWPNRPAALFRHAAVLESLGRRSTSATDLENAVTAYQKMVKEFPRSVLADDALLQMARILSGPLKKPNDAQRILAHIAKHYPKGDMRLIALQMHKDLTKKLQNSPVSNPQASRTQASGAGAQVVPVAQTAQVQQNTSGASKNRQASSETATQAPARLTQVSWKTLNSQTVQIIISLDKGATWRVDHDKKIGGTPSRLLVIMDKTIPLQGVQGSARVQNSVLKHVAVAQQNNNTALAFDFSTTPHYKTLIEEEPHRIIFNVTASEALNRAIAEKAAKEEAQRKELALQQQKEIERQKKAEAERQVALARKTERQRAEAERQRQDALAKKAAQEEALRKELALQQQREIEQQKKAEAERQLALAREAERQRKDAERQRAEAEQQRQQALAKKAAEERQRLLAAQEEARRKELALQQQREIERQKKAEAERQLALAREAEQQRQQALAKKAAEERQRLLAAQEEARRKEIALQQQREIERQKKAEVERQLALAREAERQRAEAERQRKDAERQRQQALVKKAEEEHQKLLAAQEEARRKELALQQQREIERQKKAEAERQLALAREAERRHEEALAKKAAEEHQKLLAAQEAAHRKETALLQQLEQERKSKAEQERQLALVRESERKQLEELKKKAEQERQKLLAAQADARRKELALQQQLEAERQAKIKAERQLALARLAERKHLDELEKKAEQEHQKLLAAQEELRRKELALKKQEEEKRKALEAHEKILANTTPVARVAQVNAPHMTAPAVGPQTALKNLKQELPENLVASSAPRPSLPPSHAVIPMPQVSHSPPSREVPSQTPDVPPSQKNLEKRLDDAQTNNMAAQLGLGVQTIFIDAGHGGRDPGAVNNGLVEREIVLDISKRVGRILTGKGLTVVYSRTKDSTVALSARPAHANATHADLFVSIHINALPANNVHGFETYYLDFSKNTETAQVAALENATSDRKLGDIQSLVADVMLNVRTAESSRLATDIQNATIQHLKSEGYKTRNGGTRSAPFHVLIGTNMPAVLVEAGYSTHKGEAKKLADPAYRQSLAEGIAAGILAYRKRLQNPVQLAADNSETVATR